MRLKIIALVATGGIIVGCSWFYNWRISNDTILAKHNIHDVPRRATVTEKARALPSRGVNTKTVQQYGTTAYTWTGNKTTSGTWPKERRTIAINPAKFHLGQRVYIHGFGWRIAEDIIPPESVAKGADIDIYFGRGEKAIQEARGHGRKMLRVMKEE